jgi:hypothetical protein
MKKFLVVALAIATLAFVAPSFAVADSVFYLQGQQNQVVTGGSQGQVYLGFAGQTQAGAQQSGQTQASLNTADVKVFGFTVHAVDANGVNAQGQGSSYIQAQGGAGLTLGVQKQGTVQTQSQTQLSTGASH